MPNQSLRTFWINIQWNWNYPMDVLRPKMMDFHFKPREQNFYCNIFSLTPFQAFFLHFTSCCNNKSIIFPRYERDLLNCNFIIIDKFRVLHSPWGLKQGKTTILGSQDVQDVLRQLAAETPARGLRILGNFRILVP